MTGVKVTVVGEHIAAANFRRMAYQMNSFGDALDEIGEQWREQKKAEFTAGAWAPLSPVTIALRGGSSKPLVRFGNLMYSYISEYAPMNITTIGSQTARFGSSYKGIAGNKKIVPIAAYHQGGTSKMPARPVELGNPELDQDILDEYVAHIFDGWI